MLTGMTQTVKELQLHLQSVKKQLTKGQLGVNNANISHQGSVIFRNIVLSMR